MRLVFETPSRPLWRHYNLCKWLCHCYWLGDTNGNSWQIFIWIRKLTPYNHENSAKCIFCLKLEIHSLISNSLRNISDNAYHSPGLNVVYALSVHQKPQETNPNFNDLQQRLDTIRGYRDSISPHNNRATCPIGFEQANNQSSGM